MIKDVYEPGCHEHYGIPPECWFQREGASSHTSNVVRQFCRGRFPNFWGKKSWPAFPPDLIVLDYFFWGYFQKEGPDGNPNCLDILKLAIRRSVDAAPLEMARREILAFPNRAKMRIAANVGPPKHHRLAPDLMTYPIVAAPDGEETEDDERGRIVIQLPPNSCTSICI